MVQSTVSITYDRGLISVAFYSAPLPDKVSPKWGVSPSGGSSRYHTPRGGRSIRGRTT